MVSLRMIVLAVLLASAVSAQTSIYRSVQPGAYSALATGPGNNLTISSGVATFNNALPDTVGVGDAIQYDDDGDGDIDVNDSICFIHGRTSSTSFTVKTSSGANPSDVTNDQDWSIFRAYTKLVNLETGTENTSIDADLRNFDTGNKDIDVANQRWFVACYRGTESAALLDFSGWWTSSTDYITFYSPYLATEVGVSQRHNGVLDSTICYFFTTAGTTMNFGSGGNHIRIDGIQVQATDSRTLNWSSPATNWDVRISNCILVGSDNPGHVNNFHAGILFQGANSGTLRACNNIIYGYNTSGTSTTAESGIYFGNSGTAYLYNNTIVDCDKGFHRASGTVVVKNGIAMDCGDGFVGSFDAASDYNASDIAADAPGGNSNNGIDVSFVDGVNRNYHLKFDDTVALEEGTNLSADGNLSFSTDIDIDTRPVSTYWDIGADEGTDAGGGGESIIRRRGQARLRALLQAQ